MKLKKWALIAEMIGGAAIVLTLIVLVLEVRTNSRLLERQIELDRIARTTAPMDSPYLPAIIEKLTTEFGPDTYARQAFLDQFDLTFEEAERYTRYLRGQWQAFQADFFAGVGDQLDTAVRFRLTLPDHVIFWEAELDRFEEEFIEYVNERRREIAAAQEE